MKSVAESLCGNNTRKDQAFGVISGFLSRVRRRDRTLCVKAWVLDFFLNRAASKEVKLTRRV